MPLSLEIRKRIIKMLAGKNTSDTSYSSVFPSTIYLGLSTTAPNGDGTGVSEPEGNGYQRMRLDGFYTIGMEMSAGDDQRSGVQAFPAEPTYDPTSDKYSYTNDKNIYFVEPTGPWGTCTHFVIYSKQKGSTGDYLVAYGPLTNSISPTANNIPVVRPGDLVIEEE